MRDKIFIDTNIFVYSFMKNHKNREDQKKHELAKLFLSNMDYGSDVFISTQVCSEYYNALLKNKINEEQIQYSLKLLMKSAKVLQISETTILKTMEIKNRYKFSYWDSLIVSSALENGCLELYSEDMHDGLLIDERLMIINPFRSAK